LIQSDSADAFNACTIYFPAEENDPKDDEAVIVVPVSKSKSKFALPFNYTAASIIQQKCFAETLAFHLISHLKGFDQAIVDGKPQGTHDNSHPIPSEHTKQLLGLLWIMAVSPNLIPTLLIDSSDDVSKSFDPMRVFRYDKFASIFSPPQIINPEKDANVDCLQTNFKN
jgi:hypothetical protein